MNAILEDVKTLKATEATEDTDLDEIVFEEVEEQTTEDVDTEQSWEPAPERHCGCGCYEH